MKAVRFIPGQVDLHSRLDDIPAPVAADGQTLVRLRHAAINQRDLMIARGEYLSDAPMSTMGSDGAGYVDGDHPTASLVVINPVLDWGLQERQPDRNTIRTLGVPDDGTFAESILVPRSNVRPAPVHLNSAEAAALPLAGLTAYRALFSRGTLTHGETVLVTGIGGGVAHLAAQFAIASGTRVFVTSREATNIAAAMAMGAEAGVTTESPDWARDLRAVMDQADLVIDTLGGRLFEFLPGLCREGGRIVTMGALTGFDVSVSMFTVFRKQIDIRGSSVGSPADFDGMLELVTRAGIRPSIAAEFPLSHFTEAFDFLARPHSPGKVVLQIDD